MKVIRQDQTETNKTTAFWLYEFAHDLEKKADNVDYLKQYLDKQYKNKSFSSIEEKLENFKTRLGFNIARSITDEIEKKSSESKGSVGLDNSAKDCDCKKSCTKCGDDCSCSNCNCKKAHTKTASKKSSKKLKKQIKIMEGILQYIRDMISHEPHLDPMTVLYRCKSEDGLKYNSIQKIINQEKLIKYIEDLLPDHHDHSYMMSYVPLDPHHDLSFSDSVAEYYNHAEPHRS